MILLARPILFLILVMAVLFAWRAWRSFPSLSLFAAAVATVLGILFLKNPPLAMIGALLAGGLLYLFTRPRP